MVKVGEEIEVKVLRVDPDERKIGLSRKRVEWAEEAEAEADAAEPRPAPPSIPAAELKGGVGDSSGPLIQPRPGRGRSRAGRSRRRRAGQSAAAGRTRNSPSGNRHCQRPNRLDSRA